MTRRNVRNIHLKKVNMLNLILKVEKSYLTASCRRGKQVHKINIFSEKRT